LPNGIRQLLVTEFLGNSVYEYLVSLVIFFVFLIILAILRRVVFRRIDRLSQRYGTDWDRIVLDGIKSTNKGLYVLIALYIATRILRLAPLLNWIISAAALIALAYYIVIIVQRLALRALSLFFTRREMQGRSPMDDTVAQLAEVTLKAVVWVIGAIVVLENLGVEVTTFLAGLGIVGIAIAFSLQQVLEDVFAFFSIYFDKPFEVGDFISFGDNTGTVKRIGIKSTRLQALTGQELVLSNQDLLSSRINNFRKMQRRRIAFRFGVAYETPRERLEGIPAIVEGIISELELAEYSRTHLAEMGEFTLNYEVVYFMLNTSYDDYMNTQQHIILELLSRFERAGIDMPYPTQTVRVRQMQP
jgi:small-conductance mechanosensitive channel